MDNYVIALSGSSHSGKTTFSNFLKEKLPNDVVIFDEIIRNLNIGLSIDEIRKNPKDYLELQLKIISEKIKQEKKSLELQNKVIVFDRSLIDSLYYYMFYVDKSNLSSEDMLKYTQFLDEIIFTCKDHFQNIYDKVFLFKPINIKEQNDSYRPKLLQYKQNNEYELIKSLSNGFFCMSDNFTKIQDFDAINETSMSDVIRICKNPINNFNQFTKYSEYKNCVEGKNYTLDNIITNNYGSIELKSKDLFLPYISSLLYSENKIQSDEIIDEIKKLNIDESMMNSRCYPTGIFKDNNVMIIGEAPGNKGRGIKNSYLKPSFIFSQTSHYLRYTLFNLFQSNCPYITNLSKYANTNNKITNEDFNKCFDIFKKEIQAINPPYIVALGNNVYKYLYDNLENFDKNKIIKIKHPSSVLYNGTTIEKYFEDFKNQLGGLL